MALLEIEHLKKYFTSPRGTVHAVDDVSFKVEEGKTMGLVGESGCGKSTLGRTVIHLTNSTGGVIRFQGEDVTHPSARKLRSLRENMQIIFQDPYSSLNPRMTINDTILEPLKLSGRFTKDQMSQEAERLMELTGIERRFRMSYPHELDGGRRQRVGIARALALMPKFIVCDEPVSALDVSIQAQILNLLMDLQEQFGLTYIFVTHDLSVVRHISTNICVMYLGQMVETCPTKELFDSPLHPYTQALLSAILTVDIHKKRERILLNGEIRSAIDPPPGCRFAHRCPYAAEECAQPVELREVSPGHFVSCRRVSDLRGQEKGAGNG